MFEKLPIFTLLQSEALIALGIDTLRVGRHGTRRDNFWISSLWLARIRPSFHTPAILLLSNSDNGTQAAFSVAESFSEKNVTHHTTTFASHWTDPVTQVLQSCNLLETEGATLSLDGIGYEIDIMTIANQATLRFSNPSTATLIQLQQAILQVAEELVSNASHAMLQGYLLEWQKYISD